MTDKEELTRGDALARVAVLEAENAELRKQVCVPEGDVVVPSVVVEFLKGAGQLEGLWFGQSSIDRGAFWWRKYLFAISAAPAPVERLATDGGRNQRFEGLFEGETPDQRDARLASAAPVERVELMTWAQAVDRAVRLIDEEQERLTAEGYFMDSDDCCDVLRESVGTPQPAPTAAQDVVGLVEALQLFVRWVDMEQSENVTAGVFDRLKAFRNADSKARAVLAAHQRGGAK